MQPHALLRLVVVGLKALSVRQPYAWLIDTGRKTIEVRSRRTSHRGPLLIHASKQPAPREAFLAAQRLPGPPMPASLPAGVITSAVDLVDCRPFVPRDADAACVPWRPDHWAWVLRDARRLPVPVQATGRLGVWEY